MRKPIIAGNWKMYKTRDEALQFIYAVAEKLPSIDKVDSVVCAPFVILRDLVKRQGDNLRIGAALNTVMICKKVIEMQLFGKIKV